MKNTLLAGLLLLPLLAASSRAGAPSPIPKDTKECVDLANQMKQIAPATKAIAIVGAAPAMALLKLSLQYDKLDCSNKGRCAELRANYDKEIKQALLRMFALMNYHRMKGLNCPELPPEPK